jgi:hypothetical protein
MLHEPGRRPILERGRRTVRNHQTSCVVALARVGPALDGRPNPMAVVIGTGASSAECSDRYAPEAERHTAGFASARR